MTSLRSDGVSAEVLRTQLMKANTRIEVLGAQLAALRAKTIKEDPADLTLLERVAWALASAAEAARAVQSVPFDPAGHHTPHPNDRAIPGSATRAARYQKDKLERGIEQALNAWETARENDFRPKRKKVPMVRCRVRGCPKADRWVYAWDDRDGKANEFCSGCGSRLPTPEESEKVA